MKIKLRELKKMIREEVQFTNVAKNPIDNPNIKSAFSNMIKAFETAMFNNILAQSPNKFKAAQETDAPRRTGEAPGREDQGASGTYDQSFKAQVEQVVQAFSKELAESIASELQDAWSRGHSKIDRKSVV